MQGFAQSPSPRGLFDGVLLVDKPAGPTSHDVVHQIRKTFRIEKAGHGGTLDPNATGLLLILLGKGTKLSGQLMGSDKAYTGVMRLGRVTNTQDCDGEILEEKPFDGVTRGQVQAQMDALSGDIFQTPPMVSAIKLNGVPLYKLARKGVEVPREPRLIHIYSFRFQHYHEPLGQFRVVCTKGTYVRSLVHDLGQKLGCGAHLASLRRTASGKFNVQDATPLDTVLKWSEAELKNHIIPFLKITAGD